MEAMRFSETSLLQQPRGITFQKTASFKELELPAMIALDAVTSCLGRRGNLERREEIEMNHMNIVFPCSLKDRQRL
jgi:hypothetical protein